MMNSIFENRIKKDDYYDLKLYIPERDFFLVYPDATKEAATKILETYLVYKVDDGVPTEIKIEYDRPKHLIQISAELSYLENKHTEAFNAPDILNITRDHRRHN